LRELLSQKDVIYRTKFRMADFADFLLKLAPIFSTRDEVRGLLDRLGAAQLDFSSENDPLVDLIGKWLKDESHDRVNFERSVTLTQLGKELAMLADAPHALPWEANNPQSFGQYFRNRKGTLKEIYDMSERKGQAGTTLVSFRPRLTEPLPMDDGGFGGLGEEEYEQFDQDWDEFCSRENTEVEK